MTLEFARKEAQRRTQVLGTTHFVIHLHGNPESYIVTDYVPRGHKPFETYRKEATQ